jgi:transposase
MLADLSHRRLFYFAGPTDMRKGFNGLSGLVRQHQKANLLSGDVFIFINRPRDRIKLLAWERNGFALYYKQLERGTFELPKDTNQGPVTLSYRQLFLMLEGVSLQSIRLRKRYEIPGDFMKNSESKSAFK